MKRVIYDNYNLYDRFDETKQFIMEEYPEYCTEEVEDKNGNITLEPSENRVWDFLYDDDSIEWDSIKADLKHFFDDETVLMVGSIGRWNGTFSGGCIGKFMDLLSEGLTDCDYFTIYEEDEHFYIEGDHHDGHVSYEVKLLTDKGYEYSQNWEYGYGEKKYDYSEEEMHTHLMNCSFLSRLPHFYKKVYG